MRNEVEYVARVRTGGGEWGSDQKTEDEALSGCLDRGKRVESTETKEYRVRTPTNSERINRALVELKPAAFKVHILIWKWRGAPARGTLPFFTIRSLERFCYMTRPTIRAALRELREKGWIIQHKYNKHYKNTLYSLVGIRKVPAPSKKQ